MEPSEILFVEHLGIETFNILNCRCLQSKVFPLIRDEPFNLGASESLWLGKTLKFFLSDVNIRAPRLM